MDNFLSFPLEKQYHSRTLVYFTSVFEMGTGGTKYYGRPSKNLMKEVIYKAFGA